MNPLLKFRGWMLALASLVSTALASDVSDLMTEAQRAYIRNDLATAKEKFEIVRKLDPSNKTAISYLRRIIADEIAQNAGKAPRNSTQEALQKLIMEKVELREASLAESLEFLKQKGNQLGGGKVAINFVLQLDEATQNAKITIALQKVPFSEVLRYVGDLAGVVFVYEPYAIVVKPKGAAQPAPTTATETPGAPKIPGL
ncbi:MAG: hypothetical protein ABI318_02900 [Chthoniobacteraceae bacterium]